MTSVNRILKCTSDRPTVKYIFISLWSFSDPFKYVKIKYHFFRLLLLFRLHNLKQLLALKMVAQWAETIGWQEYLEFGPLSVLLDPNYGISVYVTSQIAKASELLFPTVTKHFSHSKGNNRVVSRLGGQTLAYCCEVQVSIRAHCMWDLRWTRCHRDRILASRLSSYQPTTFTYLSWRIWILGSHEAQYQHTSTPHSKIKQDRQWTYNVTFRRICEKLLPWKSNKHYTYICVCVCVWDSVGACVCVLVCVCGEVAGRVGVCMRARALVAFRTHHATRHRGLSGSTTFFDIISQTAWSSEKCYCNIKWEFCFCLKACLKYLSF
jgi:hypothetical protein